MEKKKRVFTEEHRKNISKACIGRGLGIKQDKVSVEKRAFKLRKGSFFNCLLCNKEFWRKPCEIKKGNCKFCSKFCYLTWQIGKPKSEDFINYCKSRKGINSPTWKGGITPENKKIRNSQEFKEWRESVFKRDQYTCQDCFLKSKAKGYLYLHAHHIKSFAEYPELRFELSNGVTLCKDCHYMRHTIND